MSELDDARRRLLVGALTAGGQAIITTTNRLYFAADELARARVIDIGPEGPARDDDGAGASCAPGERRRRRRRGKRWLSSPGWATS